MYRPVLRDPDPHNFGKLGQHRSGKLNPDPHLSEKQDLDPHQSAKVEALKGHIGALEGLSEKVSTGSRITDQDKIVR